MDNIVEMLENLLGDVVETRLEEVHTSLVGRVESYDSTTQTASVQVLTKRAHVDETGQRVVRVVPPIPRVPVMSIGGGGFRLTFPIAKGDGVLIVVSEASLDRWIARGGLVDPADDARFSIKDAIAIPGLRSPADPLVAPPTDRMTLGHEGGLQLKLTTTEIQAGGVNALVTKSEFANHVHVCPAGTSNAPFAPITGTLFLRGFITLGLALALALCAISFLAGRAS